MRKVVRSGLWVLALAGASLAGGFAAEGGHGSRTWAGVPNRSYHAVGVGLAGATAFNAYAALKPAFRGRGPLQRVLDVIWGDANHIEPPKA
jgi:hypothetical protein